MATAAETIDQRRFTVEEYHRMAETGIASRPRPWQDVVIEVSELFPAEEPS